MSDPGMARRRRRRLSPSEKYEIYVSVLTGQATQREAAEQYGVDRSTVVTACRVAKQGALDALAAAVPGRPGCQPGAGGAGGGAGGDRAAAGDGDRAGGGVASARGKSALGLTAGPVPPRVDAPVKAGLLDAGRPRLRARLVDARGPARCSAWTRTGPRAGAASARRSAGGPAVRRRRGARPARRGAGRDPRAVRGVGRRRPLAPQARRPRLAARAGARLGVHGAAGAGRGRPCPARTSGP